jgi:hypothetical protein
VEKCFHGFHDPKTNGTDAILVIINQFSKFAKMVPTKMIVTTFDMVKMFFDMWVKHHEMP